MNNIVFDSRECLKNSIESFYDRLNIEMTPSQQESLLNLQNLRICLSEHGLQFPWLGMYRIPLMLSNNLGSSDIAIFVINDHVHRREQLWTRDPNIYFRGLNSTLQKKPVIMKCDRRKPLHIALAPSIEEILVLKEQIKGKISQNINWYESKNKGKVSYKRKTELFENLDFLINALDNSQKNTKTYSDCLASFNINLINKTNPDLYDKILFVSFSELMTSSHRFKTLFMDKSKEIINNVNETIEYQKDSKLNPYKDKNLSLDYLPFWFYCPKCHARNRGLKKSNNNYEFNCKNHLHYSGKNINTNEIFIAYDVISIEVFTSFFNLSKRVVGSIKNYSLAVDNVIKDVFGLEPPVRVPLSTRPVFRGIGTDEGGCTDATIFSALLEIKPDIIGKALITDWDDNPIIDAIY